MKKEFSIIIPNFFEDGHHGKYGKNETFWVANECLERLLSISDRDIFELILIDNGSTLKNQEVDNFFSKADILIRNEKNLGFAPAINQGMDRANGKYIIQMNNDILIFDNFLEQMKEDFIFATKLSPPAGILMPALIKEKLRFDEIIKLNKDDLDIKTNAGQFGIKAEFGSCYMGERDLFKKVAEHRDGYQVLDENFKWGYGEDRWLYREIRMLGFETWRTHNVRVYHVGGLTMSKIKKQDGVRADIDKNREYLAELKRKNNIE